MSILLIPRLTDLKVVVSFVTVASSLENQFGVVWPSSFAQALDAMSVLSLDFGVLLGGWFCIADITFYQRLISSTLLLLGAVGVIIVRSQLTGERAEKRVARSKGFSSLFTCCSSLTRCLA